MDPRDAAANNADLWSEYLTQQWLAFVDPFRLMRTPATEATVRSLAGAMAATVANAVSLAVGVPVTAMFRQNAPAVTRAIEQQAVPEEDRIPAEYTVVSTPGPAWEPEAYGVVVSYREPALIG